MFDIGLSEILITAIIALVVLGPERLPKAARLAGFWVRKARAQWYAVKAELESEIADEELKNSLKSSMSELQQTLNSHQDSLQQEMRSLDVELQQSLAEPKEITQQEILPLDTDLFSQKNHACDVDLPNVPDIEITKQP
jgi:sec-independent protein translocase protein TatB